jgi:hypothetical protein
MTVSQHARKAQTLGVAQFDSFSLCQPFKLPLSGTFFLHDQCCMNGARGHLTVTGGGRQRHRKMSRSENGLPPVKKATFVAEEYGAAALRINGAVGQRAPNWNPPGEAVVHGRFFRLT